MTPDSFEYDVTMAAWLFTVALGLGAGLVAAGAFFGLRRRLMLVLIAAGFAVAAASALLVMDRVPISNVEFRLKPYLTDAVLTAMLGLAFALGIAVAFRRGSTSCGRWKAGRSP